VGGDQNQNNWRTSRQLKRKKKKKHDQTSKRLTNIRQLKGQPSRQAAIADVLEGGGIGSFRRGGKRSGQERERKRRLSAPLGIGCGVDEKGGTELINGMVSGCRRRENAGTREVKISSE